MIRIGKRTPIELRQKAIERADSKRARYQREPQFRNQYISAELPTLPYVPQIILTPDSKYRMIAHG